MKKILLLIFVFCLIVAPTSAFAEQSNVSDIEKATVKIEVANCGFKDCATANGTGFFIDQSHIITNFHVIDILFSEDSTHFFRDIYLTLYDKSEIFIGSAYLNISHHDKEKDLVIIELTERVKKEGKYIKQPLKVKNVSVIPLSVMNPSIGDTVHTYGSPSDSEGFVYGSGAIKDIHPLNNRLYVNMPIVGGQSGSPVVNSENELVGVLYGKSISKKNYSYVISLSELNDFLSEYKNNPDRKPDVE